MATSVPSELINSLRIDDNQIAPEITEAQRDIKLSDGVCAGTNQTLLDEEWPFLTQSSTAFPSPSTGNSTPPPVASRNLYDLLGSDTDEVESSLSSDSRRDSLSSLESVDEDERYALIFSVSVTFEDTTPSIRADSAAFMRTCCQSLGVGVGDVHHVRIPAKLKSREDIEKFIRSTLHQLIQLKVNKFEGRKLLLLHVGGHGRPLKTWCGFAPRVICAKEQSAYLDEVDYYKNAQWYGWHNIADILRPDSIYTGSGCDVLCVSDAYSAIEPRIVPLGTGSRQVEILAAWNMDSRHEPESEPGFTRRMLPLLTKHVTDSVGEISLAKSLAAGSPPCSYIRLAGEGNGAGRYPIRPAAANLIEKDSDPKGSASAGHTEPKLTSSILMQIRISADVHDEYTKGFVRWLVKPAYRTASGPKRPRAEIVAMFSGFGGGTIIIAAIPSDEQHLFVPGSGKLRGGKQITVQVQELEGGHVVGPDLTGLFL